MSDPKPGTDPRYDRESLTGLKVADFSQLMAGPYCTRLLADLGAEVVKVESPTGDMIRTAMPLRDGRSSYWASLNVGKRSVVLDMKSPGGREAGRALVDWADIVVENFRPGVMNRLGLDYETVSAGRPELVYCSISGYGQEGPWVERPANAQVVQATSGFELATLSFQSGVDRPLNMGIFAADALGGSLAFGGVLAGVHSARETGVGRYIDMSLLDGVLSLMTYEVQNAQFPAGYDRAGYPPYRTADGWLMISALSDQHARRLLTAVGRPELGEDDRFATTKARWAHTDELVRVVEAWTGERTTAECEEVLNRAGVAAARYLTVDEVMASEHVRQRGSLAPAVDGSGEFLIANTPFRSTPPVASQAPEPHPAPLVARDPGADTRDVLAGLLGRERADDLITSGAAIEPHDAPAVEAPHPAAARG